jgi:hypothetical protein
VNITPAQTQTQQSVNQPTYEVAYAVRRRMTTDTIPSGSEQSSRLKTPPAPLYLGYGGSFDLEDSPAGSWEANHTSTPIRM